MKRRNTTVACFLFCFLVCLLSMVPAGANAALEKSVFIATPQITDLKRPLEFVSPNARARSAIFTIADPIETHLGRIFDVQLSSLIRGFQVNGYVLDRYSLPWDYQYSQSEKAIKRIPENGTAIFDSAHRSYPGILVFRQDCWRQANLEKTCDGEDNYFVVFLVGESPTYGINQRAFSFAAKCSIQLGGHESSMLSEHGNAACDKEASRDLPAKLMVVGTSFSGSINSLAIQANDLVSHDELSVSNIDVLSPSATVGSNDQLESFWRKLRSTEQRPSGQTIPLSYATLARSLERQFEDLCLYDKARRNDKLFSGSNNDSIVVFAEESTFGQGVETLANHKMTSSNSLKDVETPADHKEPPSGTEACSQGEWNAFIKRITVTTFPQNIAAIRAEHSALDKQGDIALRSVLPKSDGLLELDLSGLDVNQDRPPAFSRQLSSRSDELMLHSTIDALNFWIKPAMVVLVATDVRDRLFLLNELRKYLPSAVPVMLEMDNLVSHPDYRKITRGSIIVPASESLVCTAKAQRPQQNSEVKAAEKKQPKIVGCYSGEKKNYFAFPSGYAANIFRSTFYLLDECEAHDGKKAGRPPCSRDDPPVMVATLAGFQEASKEEHAREMKQRPLAAGSRSALAKPIYSLFLAVALFFMFWLFWLHRHGVRHQPMLSLFRYSNPFSCIKERDYVPKGSAEGSKPFALVPVVAKTIVALSSLSLATIAIYKLYGQFHLEGENRPLYPEQLLTHGRDAATLIGIFLVFACMASIATWRIFLWRSMMCGDAKDEEQDAGNGLSFWYSTRRGIAFPVSLVAIPVGLVLIAAAAWQNPHQYYAADSALISMFFHSLMLFFGIACFVEFGGSSRRWQQFAHKLAGVVDVVNARSGESSIPTDWPTPSSLQQVPQRPFSLHVRPKDLEIIYAYPRDSWLKDTEAVLNGRVDSPIDSAEHFDRWQRRLVAEMRYASQTVRTLSCCAILAPVFVLLSMSAYPAFNEKILTTISVALVFFGFVLIMFTAMRLENHPLLSRMFTSHGKNGKLGVSDIFGVLWGKLIAAALVLIPIIVPDFLGWAHGVLQSIDSLQ